jgi:hypothetical protein
MRTTSEGLYHVSDRPNIRRFEPRWHEKHGEARVWAVDGAHLHNYLLPRDCPRVSFYALPESRPEDVERLMGGSSAPTVLAVESRWVPDLLKSCLYRYDLPPESFRVCDSGAGYFISHEPVMPHSVTPIPDLLGALLACDLELRIMPLLWKLREAVIASTLQFSIIRMRNAAPPEEGYEAYHPL